MKNYVSENESIELINGDCLEVMNKMIEDGIMEYCKDHNISLINEIRRVIDRYWKAYERINK